MHQPYYRAPFSGRFALPWLRLHALKDYLGMARLAEEFPRLRLTFNLVPSLLLQLQEYLDGADDDFAELFRKPAGELTVEDIHFLVRHFFSIHYEHHVRPYPRYQALHAKKMAHLAEQPQPAWENVFSPDELRDLQVWFQLAYTDEEYKRRDPRVGLLLSRGGDFRESDKEILRDVEREILAAVIPAHRRLAGEERIEISTTPFYHPILPLLIDPQLGRVANPRLPEYDLSFSWPQDARAQVVQGLDYVEKVFGRRPVGIWPSEGSLSEAVVRMLEEVGVRWAAGDEQILARSLERPLERDPEFHLTTPELLYRPYRLAGSSLRLFFRDHYLSDLIGFHYQRFGAEEAAADLHKRLHRIAAAGREAVVPIILDGENAWEFYPGSGRDFLRAVYRRLSEDDEITTVTFAEAATRPAGDLPRLACGSWINGNFDIWIGDEEDRRAWRLLARAREEAERAAAADESRRAALQRALFIAEGSDWYWWYGRENYTPDLDIFDRLFRENLQTVYQAAGVPAPPELDRPLFAAERCLQIDVRPPQEYLSPVIDGRVTHYFEWLDAGRVDVNSYGGAMNIANPLVRSIHYGFDRTSLYLRLDTKTTAGGMFENGFALKLLLSGAARQVEVHLEKGASLRCRTLPEVPNAAAAADQVVEVRLPLAALGDSSAALHFHLEWSFQGGSFQRVPLHGEITLPVPEENHYSAYWQV